MLIIHKPKSTYGKLLTLGITITISIGAILGFSALTYTPELSHAETVNSPDHRTLTDIVYMQQVTAEICDNSSANETKQLIDSRDSKTYWVTKLKDNRCWMTQNLALNLDTSIPLTPDNSDVKIAWTPQYSTKDSLTSWSIDNNMVQSYNPGEYVYTKGLAQDLCTNTGNLSDCVSNGWQPAPGLSKDLTGNQQSHYLIGNYYSQAAASAESVTTNSICPKGWKLPTLFEYQDLIEGLNVSTTNTENNIKANPYYFLYGGIAISGSISHIGYSGYYWTLTSSGVNGLYLNLSTALRASTSLQTDRFQGFSVRCVLRDNIPDYNNNITIKVNPTITLDIASEVIVEKSDTNPSTAALPVSVASNQPYSVNISSANPDLTSTNGTTIPSKPGLLNTNENGWGIKLNTSSTYSQITSTPTTFYTATGAEVKTIPFTIGVSTSPDLPNGEYSTDITVTAVQN